MQSPGIPCLGCYLGENIKSCGNLLQQKLTKIYTYIKGT